MIDSIFQMPFPVKLTILSMFPVAALLLYWWTIACKRDAEKDFSEKVLETAIHFMTENRHEWGKAMKAELSYLQNPALRLRFALSCLWASIFLPKINGTKPALLTGLISIGAAITAGLTLQYLFPSFQMFMVLFIAFTGFILTLNIACSHYPRFTLPGMVMLIGVAGCMTAFMYITVVYPAAMQDLSRTQWAGIMIAMMINNNPFPLHNPFQMVSILFAVLLSIYVGFALNPPRFLKVNRFSVFLGAASGLLYSFILCMGIIIVEDLYVQDDGEIIIMFLTAVVPVAFYLASSALVSAVTRSFREGVEVSIWMGMFIAILYLNVSVITQLFGYGIESALGDGFEVPYPIFPTYDNIEIWFPILVGGNLFGCMLSLVLIPYWAMIFGLIGASIGKNMSGLHG